MKLYLIRHGQTDWNIQGKIQGSHDIPLNDTGRAQAKLVAEGMDSRPVTKIFSSTLMRAVETARMIGDRQQVETYLVPGLIEVEFGKWEGMTGGETQMEAMERVAGAIEAVMEMTNGREDIAVVSHGATMAYIVAYLMRNHPEEAEIIVDNASITTVNYNPITQDYMLLEVNDTAHLCKR